MLVGLLVVVAAASLLVGELGSSGGGRSWRSGVFVSYGGVGDAAFGMWRGSPVQTATDYIGSSDWAQIEDPASTIARWRADLSVTPELSVALWPATGGSLAAAASGAYNEHFVTLAKHLVAAGLGKIGLRLGWEFNGTWYRWSVTDRTTAAEYAQAWRQIVTAIRAVRGANFTFDWCPTLASAGVDPALAYPGDTYVSNVGADVYDWNQPGRPGTPEARWRSIVYMRYGLGWQARFAAAHHKALAFPEWGLVAYPTNPALAGGDDPTFILNMFDWFKTHEVAFENYFDADVPALGQYFGLTTGSHLFPDAALLYRKLYSDGRPSATS